MMITYDNNSNVNWRGFSFAAEPQGLKRLQHGISAVWVSPAKPKEDMRRAAVQLRAQILAGHGVTGTHRGLQGPHPWHVRSLSECLAHLDSLNLQSKVESHCCASSSGCQSPGQLCMPSATQAIPSAIACVQFSKSQDATKHQMQCG